MTALIYIAIPILISLMIYKMSKYFRKDAHECTNCGKTNLADYYYQNDDEITFHTTCRRCKKEYSWKFYGKYKKRY